MSLQCRAGEELILMLLVRLRRLANFHQWKMQHRVDKISAGNSYFLHVFSYCANRLEINHANAHKIKLVMIFRWELNSVWASHDGFQIQPCGLCNWDGGRPLGPE